MIEFLICGAQKSGTSALHEYLREHPEISLSKTKELHIFDNESRDWSEKGIRNIDQEIEHQFEDNGMNRRRGESTPSSMWWKPAMERIWKYNSNMKLIAILRNPITRAYSNWKMEVNKGRDSEIFPLSVMQEELRCKSELPLQHRVYSYISRGMYSEQIQRIWNYFPKENLLLLKQEELRYEHSRTLNKVYKHIGVEQVKTRERKEVESWNSRVKKATKKGNDIKLEEHVKEEIKNELKKIYKKEIQKLEEITKWNCSEWYE